MKISKMMQKTLPKIGVNTANKVRFIAAQNGVSYTSQVTSCICKAALLLNLYELPPAPKEYKTAITAGCWDTRIGDWMRQYIRLNEKPLVRLKIQDLEFRLLNLYVMHTEEPFNLIRRKQADKNKVPPFPNISIEAKEKYKHTKYQIL